MPGRVKCGGTEGEIVVAHSSRKRKKMIFGTEGEIVVAHDSLPSPTRSAFTRSFYHVKNFDFVTSAKSQLGNNNSNNNDTEPVKVVMAAKTCALLL